MVEFGSMTSTIANEVRTRTIEIYLVTKLYFYQTFFLLSKNPNIILTIPIPINAIDNHKPRFITGKSVSIPKIAIIAPTIISIILLIRFPFLLLSILFFTLNLT